MITCMKWNLWGHSLTVRICNRALTKNSVFKTFYGRGTKVVPPYVSFFFLSPSHVFIDVLLVDRTTVGTYLFLLQPCLIILGIPTYQSSFLPQTTTPNRSTSQRKQILPFFFLLGDHMYLDWRDCSCIHNVLVMNRRTDLWGPDGMITALKLVDPSIFLVLVFDPDRFLDERVKKYIIPNPFIFCPLNAGPRICLEQQVYANHSCFLQQVSDPNYYYYYYSLSQFAYYEATFALVSIVHWICFRWICKP